MARLPLKTRLLAPLYVLSVLVAGGCGGAGGTSIGAKRTGPEAIFGAPGQLLSNPAGTLDQLHHLGVDRVRLSIRWSALAPAPGSRIRPSGLDAASPSAYPAGGWSGYDAVVRDAVARRIGLYLSLEGPAPLWATGTGAPVRGGPYPQWEPSATEFGAFVHAVATRYSGNYTPPGSSAPLPRVSFWSVWNEPNYGIDLAPQAIEHSTIEVAPRTYRGLLDAAWAALGATGHGRDTILIGELAPRGQTIGDYPGNFAGMVPLRFLRALYCVDSSFNPLRGGAAAARGCPANGRGFRAAHPALFQASGFAAHLYPQGQNPTVPTWPNPGPNQYADFPQVPALLSLLDRANRAYGSPTRFNLYNTEYGYRTNPPEGGQPNYTTAANWLNWGEYLSWRNPRITTFMQYLFLDPPKGNYPSGLENSRGRPKNPIYSGFRLPLFLPSTSTRPGRKLEVWGCVRPAHSVGATRAQVQLKRAHGGFKTITQVSIGRNCYFDVHVGFPASGSVRLAWTDPTTGSTSYSRSQPITIR